MKPATMKKGLMRNRNGASEEEAEVAENSRRSQTPKLAKVRKKVKNENGKTPATNAVAKGSCSAARHVRTCAI